MKITDLSEDILNYTALYLPLRSVLQLRYTCSRLQVVQHNLIKRIIANGPQPFMYEMSTYGLIHCDSNKREDIERSIYLYGSQEDIDIYHFGESPESIRNILLKKACQYGNTRILQNLIMNCSDQSRASRDSSGCDKILKRTLLGLSIFHKQDKISRVLQHYCRISYDNRLKAGIFARLPWKNETRYKNHKLSLAINACFDAKTKLNYLNKTGVVLGETIEDLNAACLMNNKYFVALQVLPVVYNDDKNEYLKQGKEIARKYHYYELFDLLEMSKLSKVWHYTKRKYIEWKKTKQLKKFQKKYFNSVDIDINKEFAKACRASDLFTAKKLVELGADPIVENIYVESDIIKYYLMTFGLFY